MRPERGKLLELQHNANVWGYYDECVEDDVIAVQKVGDVVLVLEYRVGVSFSASAMRILTSNGILGWIFLNDTTLWNYYDR